MSFTTLRFAGFRENWVLKALPYAIEPYLSVNMNFARVENNLGTVQIQSTDAFDPPVIELNHFKSKNGPQEISDIIQNIRFLRKLLMEGLFSEHIAYENMPGSQLQTDEELANYVKKNVWVHE